MQGTINRLHEQIKELNEKCQIYLESLRRFPEKVKAFFDELLKPKEKPQEKYEPTPWDIQIPDRNTKKTKGGWER